MWGASWLDELKYYEHLKVILWVFGILDRLSWVPYKDIPNFNQ